MKTIEYRTIDFSGRITTLALLLLVTGCASIHFVPAQQGTNLSPQDRAQTAPMYRSSVPVMRYPLSGGDTRRFQKVPALSPHKARGK